MKTMINKFTIFGMRILKKNSLQKLFISLALSTAIFGTYSLIRAGGFMSPIDNDFIKTLKEKFAAYNEQFPEDRVYLQFDKPFYQPGETMWFSAYVRNGADMKPSEKSDILHVELIGPKGNKEKEIKLIAKNGRATGDFTLDSEAPGGMYKIKAYTNWQLNEEDTVFFEKELQVQDIILPNLKMNLDFEKKAFGADDEVTAKIELNTNENTPLSNYNFKYAVNLDGQKLLEAKSVTGSDGTTFLKFNLPGTLKTTDGLLNILVDYQGQTESVSRSIPIVLNKIKMTMFPEGGDLISGLESRVAFKAVNEYGKAADVVGKVYNKSGMPIASFSSYHMGMGAFDFKPMPGDEYYAKITKPEGISEKFELPEPIVRGYVLNVDNVNTGQLDVTINSTEVEDLSLVAQIRGKIVYAYGVKVGTGSNKIIIPTGDFPMGVAQLTLFDSKGIERAERLVFVNKDKQLNVSIETDKEKYLPREKVKMTISVKDERGMPMPASLSLAVANDQLLSFADDKSGNILSKLLLEPDIAGTVEEPSFYFNKKEAKADKALDYLMMTSGWRRYTWKQVLSNNVPMFSYQGEKAIIGGTIIDYYTGKPIPNADITIGNTKRKVQTNAKGEFLINNLDLSETVSLNYSAKDYTAQALPINDYNNNLKLYLYGANYYNANNYNEEEKGENNKWAVPCAAGNAAGNDGNLAFNNNVKKGNNRQVAFENNKQPGKVKEKVEKQAVLANKDDKQENNFHVGEQVNGVLDFRAKLVEADDKSVLPVVVNQVVYYHAKEFSSPVYDKDQSSAVRNDFRSTIYWNGNIDVDRTGKKVIEFYNSDEISSFKATVEGISDDGMVGRAEKTFYTQLPFAMKVKIPVEVATQDIIDIPLTLKNNTPGNIAGTLTVKSPAGLQLLTPISAEQFVAVGKTKVIYLEYKVLDKIGIDTFSVAFNNSGFNDAISQQIKIAAKGFPVTNSFSGNEIEKEYSVNLANVVDGSIKLQFTAFPSVVSDLMQGVESILREPSGCFEQTSMSSYPNVMVMDYLKTTENKDDKLLASAEKLLDKGYKRLITFETVNKGYEWFGSSPGHEALTAYGLMQFNDMKEVYKGVDQKMIDRTADWLLDRRDGEGSFKRNPEALDNFGAASEEITNAYIVWALSEAGYTDKISKEINRVYRKAMDAKDPYQLALVANALYKCKDETRGAKALEELLSLQAKDGSWTGLTHSVTHSSGISLTIETTSLAILAILKSTGPDRMILNKAVEYLVKSRSGYGAFGSTQGTILALKALTAYAKASKQTKENGKIEFYIDGKKVAEKSYLAGEKEAIVIDGLEKYLKPGKHDLKIKYIGVENPLPYSIATTWNTFLPNSNKECTVSLATKLASKVVNVGETVRLTATLKNVTKDGQPSTMVIIGIPGGLSVQPWQLKELQEKKVCDYYEVSGNNVFFYYRQMLPSEEKIINLDLKAEIPGEYDSPASCAYLYYTNEFKSWCSVDRITVKKLQVN